MALTAQSVSINHARRELRRKSNENPTRVATEELQLQERVRAEACNRGKESQLPTPYRSRESHREAAKRRAKGGRSSEIDTYSLSGTEESETSHAGASSRGSESGDRSQQRDREERAHAPVSG